MNPDTTLGTTSNTPSHGGVRTASSIVLPRNDVSSGADGSSGAIRTRPMSMPSLNSITETTLVGFHGECKPLQGGAVVVVVRSLLGTGRVVVTAPPHMPPAVSSPTKVRIGGLFISLLLAVGVPVFVFGPALFNGVPVADIPFGAKAGAAVSALLGWWLGIVSYAAAAADVEKGLEPFQAGNEVVLLFVPRMLWVGTKSVLHRCGYGKT
jgi:hypothetical protein